MAGKEFTRQLNGAQIEEIGYAVAQAHAVACLMNADIQLEDTATNAAGAILERLRKALDILEKKPEARHG